MLGRRSDVSPNCEGPPSSLLCPLYVETGQWSDFCTSRLWAALPWHFWQVPQMTWMPDTHGRTLLICNRAPPSGSQTRARDPLPRLPKHDPPAAAGCRIAVRPDEALDAMRAAGPRALGRRRRGASKTRECALGRAPTDAQQNRHRCPEGLILALYEAHDRRFADGSRGDLGGAGRDWAGREDGARPVRRRRGRISGRRQAAGSSGTAASGRCSYARGATAAHSGFVCSTTCLPVARASGRAG